VELFNAVGGVDTLKILRDKTTGESSGYGFVEFVTPEAATAALTQLNGVDVYGNKLKVNWAIHGTAQREDTSAMHHIFIGDLSSDVNEQALKDAFKNYQSIADVRVMYDKETGKSRGYGFIVFRSKEDADQVSKSFAYLSTPTLPPPLRLFHSSFALFHILIPFVVGYSRDEWGMVGSESYSSELGEPEARSRRWWSSCRSRSNHVLDFSIQYFGLCWKPYPRRDRRNVTTGIQLFWPDL